MANEKITAGDRKLTENLLIDIMDFSRLFSNIYRRYYGKLEILAHEGIRADVLPSLDDFVNSLSSNYISIIQKYLQYSAEKNGHKNIYEQLYDDGYDELEINEFLLAKIAVVDIAYDYVVDNTTFLPIKICKKHGILNINDLRILRTILCKKCVTDYHKKYNKDYLDKYRLERLKHEWASNGILKK